MSSSLPSSSLEGSISISRFGPRLCDRCNELLSAVELSIDLSQPNNNSVKSEYYQNLYKSARYGCQICLMFKNDLELYPELEDGCWDETTLEIVLTRSSPSPRINMQLRSTSTGRIDLYGRLAETVAYPGTSSRQRVFEELNSIRAYHDLDYTPPKSTDDQKAWKLCDAWVKNCINNHSRCKSFNSSSWYPTRLLYIGHLPNGYLDKYDLCSSNVQLHLTQDKPPKGGYMTLSHCWGFIAFEMLKLTGETYKYRLKNGFSYTELPKTFQDAVRLSRFLHSDYIWIDSLCIIQGSEDDWIHESKAMMDVYRHSKCNIAATSAQGPTEGCFYTRDPTLVSPLEISLRLGKEDRAAKKYLFSSDESWYVNIEHAPLNRRAWVFQERTLSPRQIHCAKDQLSWECNQTTACETFPFIFEPHIEFKHFISLAQNLTSLNLTLSEIHRSRSSETRRDSFLGGSLISYPMESADSTSHNIPRFERTLALLEEATPEERIECLRSNIYLDWNDIVSWYSNLELTYKTDRLVAVFGIASRVQEALKDTYVAGLWYSRIPWMLFWLAGTSETAPSYDAGPSWSWANVDRRAYFQIVPEDHDRVLINIDEAHDGHTGAKKVAMSSHKASYLKLRCLIFKIEPDDIAANSGKKSTTRFITPTNPRLSFRPRSMNTDGIETVDYWHQAYIIPVVDRRGKNMIWALLVRLCEEEPGCYRRIGVCWIDTDAEPNITEHARGATDEDKVRVTLI